MFTCDCHKLILLIIIIIMLFIVETKHTTRTRQISQLQVYRILSSHLQVRWSSIKSRPLSSIYFVILNGCYRSIG